MKTKILFFLLFFITFIFSCNTDKNKTDLLSENTKQSAKDFIDASFDSTFTPQNAAQQFVYNMGFGWNLGNTLDATHWNNEQNAGLTTETGWGQPLTTKEIIQGLAKSGIKTIRIPVSWHNHISDTNYTIDSEWMARVKTIVDWAIAENLYVILNIHHDNVESLPISYGKGFYPTTENKTESIKFLTRIWEQIATTFNNYDNHLIFEVMNEPRMIKDEHEWGFNKNCRKCQDAMNCVNDFNQICLDTIRLSGGQNTNRFVMFPAIAASPDASFSDLFKIPVDSRKNALILSVHMYTPYPFAMGVPGGTDFTNNDRKTLDYYFNKLNEKYISKGIPVIIGEMGATNKDNLEDRAEWFAYFIQHSKKYGITSCLWDNGNYQPSTTKSERYGYYNRTEQKWYFPLLLEIALEASK